jgi:hypothetical protein
MRTQYFINETYNPITYTWTTVHTWYIFRKNEPFINNANQWWRSLKPFCSSGLVDLVSSLAPRINSLIYLYRFLLGEYMYVAVETLRKKHCYSDRVMLSIFRMKSYVSGGFRVALKAMLSTSRQKRNLKLQTVVPKFVQDLLIFKRFLYRHTDISW